MLRQTTSCSLALLLLSFSSFAHRTNPWQGYYIGGFTGGASHTKTFTTEPLRLDNGTYWYRPFHDSYNYTTNASFIGGATLGYNWNLKTTPYVVGIEGEYGYLNTQGSSRDPNELSYARFTGLAPNNSVDSTNIASGYGYGLAGGRVGYIQNSVLYYLKTGAVFTRAVSKYVGQKTEAGRTAYLHISGINNITGYGIGGGIEYSLPLKALKNFSLKAEYLYLGIDKSITSYGDCTCDFLWTTEKYINGIHTAKIGLNYAI